MPHIRPSSFAIRRAVSIASSSCTSTTSSMMSTFKMSLIDLPIGIHPYQREKMAVRRDHPTARSAQTFYEVIERFDGFAAVRVLPKTGRTHQIRVHLNAIGCPVPCDRHYGGRAQLMRDELRGDPADTQLLLERQALHAARLALNHPDPGQRLEFLAP